jgi:hypothetical protein
LLILALTCIELAVSILPRVVARRRMVGRGAIRPILPIMNQTWIRCTINILMARCTGVDIKELLAETSEEEAETDLDKEITLKPRFLVALSSLPRENLAGAEKECLHKGDFSQES